jgi:hypothetical protein
MRADQRLLAVIKKFSQRIRLPSFPSKQISEHGEQPGKEGAAALVGTGPVLLLHSHIGRQVVANPVVQEAMHVFSAKLTDIEILPSARSSPLVDSKPASPGSVEGLAQDQNGEIRRSQTFWDLRRETLSDQAERIEELEAKVHDLETQVRRQELQKEALRRQVKALGGNKPWA